MEDTVRSILVAKGTVLHGAVGVADGDWLYTENDLTAIAPPLTRILNRYDATRAAAGSGDELALLIGLGGYVSRSYQERRAVLRAIAEQEPEPASGVAAEAGEPEPAETAKGGTEWKTPA